MKIPENYLAIMPYLIVRDASRFLQFARDIFGATEQFLTHRSEGVIMHGEIRIQEAVIMFADATPEYAPCTGGMFLYVDGADEIYARVVAAGLPILNTLEDRPYGRGFGFSDDFGNTWWVNTPL